LGASLRAGLSPLAFFAVEEACKKELRQWLNPSRRLILKFQFNSTKNGSKIATVPVVQNRFIKAKNGKIPLTIILLCLRTFRPTPGYSTRRYQHPAPTEHIENSFSFSKSCNSTFAFCSDILF